MADALNKWNHADFGAIDSKIPFLSHLASNGRG
jgi:hypothetical protein